MPHISIDVVFEWGPWVAFDDLIPFQKRPARGPIPARAGVYEVRRTDAGQVLLIGSSSKLTRLYQDILAESAQGSKEKRHLAAFLRDEVQNQVFLLALRWAEINECFSLAVQCELIREHIQIHGSPPKYRSF